MPPGSTRLSSGRKWTSSDVKAALRRRHPGETVGSMTGQWTCIDEWADIDMLAINAWKDADVVGYEVKVSRSDYRAEVRQPTKRAAAVAMCTEFYFAVPAGLLKPGEIAFEEPEWQPEDWERTRCPGVEPFGPPDEHAWRRHDQRNLLDRPPGRYGGPCRGRGHTGSRKGGWREKGPFTVALPVPWAPPAELPRWVESVDDWQIKRHGSEEAAREDARAGYVAEAIREAERYVQCPTCGGKGYLEVSRVEAEAPTLWVPRDVGLIEVTEREARVVKKSPKRTQAPGLLPVAGAYDARSGRQQVAHIIRWVSNRPDPRHLPMGVRDAA